MQLLLETATQVCSVALAQDGKVLREIHSDQSNAHSTKLALFIDQIFHDTDHSMRELDAVCVSSGPGSYTGLRIGVSSAKGICYALDIPLLSVPTLQSMAALYYDAHPNYNGAICPMIDARRMECYTAIFERKEGRLVEIKAVSADIIDTHSYDTFLDQQEVTFIGDGATKTQPLLGVHPHARYDGTFRISAEGMVRLAQQKYQQQQYEDVAYFEPFYLKDFVAKKSVVRGLR